MRIFSILKTVYTALCEPNQNKGQIRGKFMYIVKADNEAVRYSVEFDALDSEGNPVDESDLKVDITTDNSDVVSVETEEEGNQGSGKLSFGHPGLANINITVTDARKNLLGSFGAQFTVVAGDVASIAGGSLVIDGLEEV